MEFIKAKQQLITVQEEFNQISIECNEFNRIHKENLKKMRACEGRKNQLLKVLKQLENIIESETMLSSVTNFEGIDTLSQDELTIICSNMDKTNYNKCARSYENNYPRWYDLEGIVKEVIEFKKLYPGWTLDGLQISGKYDTMPPQNFYKYTYKTPYGHYMSHGGIEQLI